MLRLILPLLLAILALAQEPSVFDMMKEERSEKVVKRPKIPVNVAPTNEPEINLKDTQIYQKIEASKLVLKVANLPKQVFEGEIFKFTLTADTQDNISVDISAAISENENIKWINPNPQWQRDENGVYKSEIYLEANSSKPKNPKITVSLKRNGELFQSASLQIPIPKIKELKADENFNHIVADMLEIKKYKTTKFDDKNYIMVAEIAIKNGNIADFYLKDSEILKQGVDSINGNFISQNGYYFAVFAPQKQSIDFSYFNLKDKEFKGLSIPIILEDDEISTQIGLNPKQSKLQIYKSIAAYILLFASIVMFVIKRSYIYIVATVIFGAYVLYDYNPFGDGVLKENVRIKILPTQNSTIFYTTTTQEKVEILGERDDYRKVLLNDGKIGWADKDDFIKN